MPAMAICTERRLKPSMVLPGIWNVLTTSQIACMVSSGASPSAAWSTFR